MKKLSFSTILGLMAVMLGVFGLASCSSSDAGNVADTAMSEYASKDNLLIISGNAWDIYENLGCTLKGNEIEISDELESFIKKMERRHSDEVIEALELPGIDPRGGFFIMDFFKSKPYGCCFLSIYDDKKFGDFLDELGVDADTDQDGYKVWTDGDIVILLKDGMAKMVLGERSATKAIGILDKFKEKAESAPLEAWQKGVLDEKRTAVALINVGGALKMASKVSGYNPLDAYAELIKAAGVNPSSVNKSYLICCGKLSGSNADATWSFVDNEGKIIESSLFSKVDASLLKYAGSNEYAVAMMAVDGKTDWTSILKRLYKAANPYGSASDMNYIEQAGEILSMFDGTSMAAIGIKDGADVTRLTNEMYACQMVVGTLATQMAPGKASEAFFMIKDFLAQAPAEEITCTMTAPNALEITILELGVKVYMKLEGDTFIVSYNKPISDRGGCPVDESVFSGSAGGYAVSVDKGNSYLERFDVEFGADYSIVVKDGQVVAHFGVVGSDKPLLLTILDLASRF